MPRKGKVLEDLIWSKLKEFNDIEIGYFIKSPTPSINVPLGNGKYRFVYSSKALCDFSGIYLEKFILIEAKELCSPRFSFERIKKHQLDQLIKIKKYGGLSLIIFLINEIIIVVDISEYIDFLEQQSKKSVKTEILLNIGRSVDMNDFNLEKLLFESIVF